MLQDLCACRRVVRKIEIDYITPMSKTKIILIGGAFLGIASLLSIADTRADTDLIVIDDSSQFYHSQAELYLSDIVWETDFVSDFNVGVEIETAGLYPVPLYREYVYNYVAVVETRCRSPGNLSIESAVDT